MVQVDPGFFGKFRLRGLPPGSGLFLIDEISPQGQQHQNEGQNPRCFSFFMVHIPIGARSENYVTLIDLLTADRSLPF